MASKRLNATRPLIEAPPVADDSVGLICVVVPVPNTESYKAMLLGVLRVAGKWTNYIESGTTRETEVAQFWNELIDMVEFDICDCVADCIDTSALVQSALANAIDTKTIIQNSINTIVQNAGTIDPDKINPDIALIPTRFPQSERDNNVHVPPPACDKDALWAGIRETVKRLDDGARQFLEQAVAQADKAERAANITSAIPLVGDLASALITTFSELAPDLLNLFNAYSSAANIDDTACKMFEIVCNECRYPTYQEYWNHYSNAGISGLDDIGSLTFTAITDLLFGTQNLAALVAYHTIISYQLYVLYLGSTFTSYRGTKWLDIWADIGEDNPNNGWELLCSGCADTFCYEYDFTIDAQGWTVWSTGDRPFGVYVAGVGWQCTYDNVSGAGNDNRAYLENLNWAQQTGVTRIEADVIPTNGGSSRSDDARVQSGTSSIENHDLAPQTVINSTLQTVGADFSSTGDGIRVLFVTNTGAAADQDAITIQKIRVYYTSGQPEDGQAC